MLRRVFVPALAASLALALGPAVPSVARQARPRVVVLTVDGTSIEDWIASDVFGSVGATALLATRTATETGAPNRLRAAAYTTLGAGAPAELEPGEPRTEAGPGVLAGALGEALARRGLSAAALGDASGDDVDDAPAGRAVMRADGSIPSAPAGTPAGNVSTWRSDPSAPAGRRTDYAGMRARLEASLAWASVVVADLGDPERADRTYAGSTVSRAPWVARALRDAAGFAEDVRALLGPADTLIVASLLPPLDRVRDGVHLGAVAIGGARGLAYSGTTRRPGVLSLTDLGPTILERAGVPIPEEMQGRDARFAADASPLRTAVTLDAELVRAKEARRPLTRWWLILSATLSAIAFLTIAAGRGPAPGRERLPRRLRDLLATGLVASAAAPAAMLVAPLLPGAGVAAIGWWTLGLSVGTALVLRFAAGVQAAVAIGALLGAGLVLGDLVAGTPLASRSPLGFQIAGGGRFYGIDEGLLGVVLAGVLVSAAAFVDAAKRPGRTAAALTVPLAAAAVVAAAPALGSKFGATFTLIPAFGAFVLLASGRRPDRTGAIGVAIATALAAGSLAAADALAAPASRTHIGRELAGGTPVGPLIVRKLTSFLEITGTTVWLPVALAVAVPAVLFLFRRRNLLARGFWGMPGRRAALAALVVGCVAAMGSNDTGIIVVTPALVVGAASYYGALLAPPLARAGGRADGWTAGSDGGGSSG